MKLAYAQSSHRVAHRTRGCFSGILHGHSSLHDGFTLLEVLIAIVVLSIGLLGLAGLQAAGLRNNNSAYMRTVATQQISDMADRIRANPAGRTAGDYNAIAGIPANPGCIASVGGCTPLQVSAFDAFEWNTNNAALLPTGQGTVIPDPVTPNRFIITVMWDDARTGAVGTACGGVPAVDLTCFVMRVQP